LFNAIFVVSGFTFVSFGVWFCGMVFCMRDVLLDELFFEVDRWLLSCDFDWDAVFFDEFLNVTFRVDGVDVVSCFVKDGVLLCGFLDSFGDVVDAATFSGVSSAWSCALWVGCILFSF
jgi:hypothetical protein